MNISIDFTLEWPGLLPEKFQNQGLDLGTSFYFVYEVMT